MPGETVEVNLQDASWIVVEMMLYEAARGDLLRKSWTEMNDSVSTRISLLREVGD
jgi:hypothetical protein